MSVASLSTRAVHQGLSKSLSSGTASSRPRLQSVKAHCSAAPRNAEELFKPFSFEGAMPERAQAYLSLLAESSTAPGGMQRHLIKLLAAGACGASKVAGLVQNPLDSVQDAVLDTGSRMLLERLSGVAKEEAAKPSSGWSKLRRAVLGVSVFKSALKTRDDSCLPDPGVNPAHSKALSLMLSLMMSAATTGIAAHAAPEVHLPAMAGGAPTESVMPASQSKASFQFATLKAPSLAAQSRTASSGAEGLAGAGGMAASTAMKLLRADSKRVDFADLDKILGSVLDSVHESIDEDDGGGFGGHRSGHQAPRAA